MKKLVGRASPPATFFCTAQICRAGIARQGWAVRTLRKHRRDACTTDLKNFSEQENLIKQTHDFYHCQRRPGG